MYLSLVSIVDLDKLRTSDGCITNSRLPEVVSALEDLANGWCQQIEQVSIWESRGRGIHDPLSSTHIVLHTPFIPVLLFCPVGIS